MGEDGRGIDSGRTRDDDSSSGGPIDEDIDSGSAVGMTDGREVVIVVATGEAGRVVGGTTADASRRGEDTGDEDLGGTNIANNESI